MTLLLALVACTGAPGDSGGSAAVSVCDDGGPHLSWANWGDGFFANYCRACHSVNTRDRYDAPVGVDFDTQEQVETWAERIRVRVLEEETMPVGGGVYSEDVELLDRLLTCGM